MLDNLTLRIKIADAPIDIKDGIGSVSVKQLHEALTILPFSPTIWMAGHGLKIGHGFPLREGSPRQAENRLTRRDERTAKEARDRLSLNKDRATSS